MSIAPRPGMLRFDGDVAVFYMAICQQCDIALPHPTEMSREMWATGHRGTGHTVTYALDVRPDTGQTENRRRQLVDRLREKYSNPMPANRGGSCAGIGKTCGGPIVDGQPYVQWNGKLWHAECLDDGSYLRMATVADIAPGVFVDVEPVTIKSWIQGEDWARANPSYRFTGSGPQTVTAPSDPLQRHANFVSALGVDLKKIIAEDVAAGYDVTMVATNIDEQPKKLNARQRRRQRREGKQWRRGS